MDAYEATRIVFSRIQALDPENAAKIMGLLLIQDHGEKVMIRLAFGPETLLHSLILKARKDLGLLPPPPPSLTPSTPSTPSSSPFLLSRHNSRGPNSPSSWAPPPPSLPFSRSNNEVDGVVFDAVDEYLLQDHLSVLNDQATAAAAADQAGYWDQGFGWKPCLYFARGFCKNGSSCMFLHGPASAATVEQQCQELLLMRSKSQRLAASAAAAFPYSPTGKFMSWPRMERANPGSRQIYLTFPADSNFREEDVSDYFNMYGPVQDVRIPYQQKRMFGFVTFLYTETVKLILAKGNPHFVCDARVLVKPYKEKGKVPDKKLQEGERIDFSGLDSRDPYDLQQQLASARMLYNNQQDVILRRKMEEQQAAIELQQAIEMQGRRFMGLQLLDIKNRNLVSQTAPIFSPLATTPTSTTAFNTTLLCDGSSSNGSQDEAVAVEDKSLSPVASGTAAVSTVAAAAQEQTAVNSEERAPAERTPNEDISYHECAEHNLPDSPFASLAHEEASLASNVNGHLIASTLLPPYPLDNMASFKSSCFFQMPRFSSGHGAVGL